MDSNLQKIKSMLNINEKVKEHLHIVKLMQDENFKTVIENITNVKFDDPLDFLKYKILNQFKYSKYIQNLIIEDNKNIIKTIKYDIDDIGVRDNVLGQFLSGNVISTDTKTVNSCLDIKNILQQIDNSKLKKVNLTLLNPFNNLEVVSCFDKSSKDAGSYIITYERAIFNRKTDNVFEMYLSYNSLKDVHGFNIFDNKTESEIAFEFTLYHELAHASYGQILNKMDKVYDNKGEINSDISAIIKIIKNHSFDKHDSLKLCDHILKFRASLTKYFKTADTANSYFAGNNLVRTHFTEEAILNFKKFIVKSNDMLRNIPDTDIPAFAELFVKNYSNSNDLVVNQSNNDQSVLKIMAETIINTKDFVNARKRDYAESYLVSHFPFQISDNIKDSINNMMNRVPSEFIEGTNKRLIKQCMKHTFIFKDIYIIHNLKTSFDSFTKNCLCIDNNDNRHLSLIDDYNAYKESRKDNNYVIEDNFTHKQLTTKIKPKF